MLFDFQPKYLDFDFTIDFNFLADCVSKNHLEHIIGWDYMKHQSLDNVFQIKKISVDRRFHKILEKLDKDFNTDPVTGALKQRTDIAVFFSMMSGSKSTLHKDIEDVHIIGCLGTTIYLIEDQMITITPGDRLFIKRGTNHKAISMSPRIVRSYGVYYD